MPKDHFSLEKITSLTTLAKGARIHVIGVAGVAMGQIAMRLQVEGYSVSGSDKEFYEPMGGELVRSGIKLMRGYSAANIEPEVELVVIGNVVSYGHEEVLEVERRNLPYTIFPAALAEIVIGDKHSIVVSGTHGKSTTSALIGATLRQLNLRPSYFVGGVLRDFPESLYVNSGMHSVVEGDEYDSAFFAKVPKFTFYKPRTLIITSVEFDHADIYSSLEVINREFTKLVHSVPEDGAIICSLDGDNLKGLVEAWRTSCAAPIVTYGTSPVADYRIVGRTFSEHRQIVSVVGPKEEKWSFLLTIPGEANAKNALAAIIAAKAANVPREMFVSALSKFHGVKRRQEALVGGGGVVLIEDFAHHPTAVKETIVAIREFYPGRLWAVFEPRSNTSRKRVFQSEYVKAFLPADKIVLCDVAKRGNDSSDELLDVRELSDDICRAGGHSICLPDPGQIRSHLLRELKRGDVCLIMSNGSFGGLTSSLDEALRGKIKL